MKVRRWSWRLAGVALFALAFCSALAVLAPAALVAAAIEDATAGRIVLSGAQGRLWSGLGTLHTASGSDRTRLAWTLSPWSLLQGRATGSLNVGGASPVDLVAGAQSLQTGAFDITLPAGLVAAAAGDYAAYRLGGEVRLRAERATIDGQGAIARIAIDWTQANSGLIDVVPLGSYSAEVGLAGRAGTLQLRTREGPLMLDGSGRWAGTDAQIAITARPTGERADRLAVWLQTMATARGDGSFRYTWPHPVRRK